MCKIRECDCCDEWGDSFLDHGCGCDHCDDQNCWSDEKWWAFDKNSGYGEDYQLELVEATVGD